MFKIKESIKAIVLASLGFVLTLGVTFGVLYGFGTVENKLEETIGVQYDNAKRKRFENSTSYIHSMQDKLAILNCIDDEFAQFDENKISSSILRDFLISVKDGSLRMELNN